MPRGGPRPGAGRPRRRLLDAFYRLTIGDRCEQLWREAWQAALQARINAPSEYLKAVAKIQSIPLAGRRRLTPDQRDNIKFALREDQRRVGRREKRLVTVTAPRPWGLRKPIIERVAREESKKCDRRITPRMVKSCWDESRIFWAKKS